MSCYNTKLLLIFCCCFSIFGKAQDVHFSHVNRQPIYQNPASAGLFQGDIRLTANYKDQWRAVTVPFTTMAFAADGRTKWHGWSWAGLFFYDKVGDGKFQTIELTGSISKRFLVQSDSSQTLSFGLQSGLNFRQLDQSKFYFDNQWNGLNFDPNLPTGEVFQSASRANLNISVGSVYQWNRSKKESSTIGFSAHNLNRPDQSFYGEPLKRDIRLSFFGTSEHFINQDLSITPGFSLNFQGKYREFVPGAQAKYVLIDKLGEYRAVDGGLWFRSRDAVIVRLGLAMQNWSVALSYDTNISKLIPASNARGGLELSAHYIISRFKPKKITHRICPDFI